jgi:hypothetical protein
VTKLSDLVDAHAQLGNAVGGNKLAIAHLTLEVTAFAMAMMALTPRNARSARGFGIVGVASVLMAADYIVDLRNTARSPVASGP